jgi:signal transduction histidine kinase
MAFNFVNSRRIRIVFIISGILGTSLAHYYTPSSLILWHNIFQRLYYLPVVYGALSFGWVGGLLAALLAAICYIPHILIAWHQFPGYVINQYAEIVLFFLVGAVTGLLADEQREKHQALEETTIQLKKVYQELQDSFEHVKRAERLAAIGNLSAGLAHEIRNPLASIEGAADILEQGRVTEEQRMEFLGIIKKECHRLNRLLTNLLDFARPRPPERSKVLVNSWLDSVVNLTGHTAGKKAITIQMRVTPPQISLEGDEEQLKQVLLNLLLNAIQAMPSGGEILLTACSQESRILIEVIDEGSGVTAQDLEKMFNPFFTTKEDGTGLGLAVAHQIISQHGGTLSARNNPEKGMTFSITLPQTPEN